MDAPWTQGRADVGEDRPQAGAGRVAGSSGPDLSRHAVDLRTRHRPCFTLRTHLCSWDIVVFAVEPSAAGPAVYVAKAHDEVRAFMDDVDAGRRDADLAAALRRPPRRRVRRPLRERQPLRTGVEHEYRLLGPAGQVDVRTLVDGLDLGVRADPTDPHAQRCAWGGVVTADGREAEVATPPVEVAPGAAAEVVALAAVGRSVLATALRDIGTLEGYSTHLNISAPRRGDQRLARRFATIFAPSLMLLLDRATSPGLLVRPRPGRLELGGEFADGTDLEVALIFAIGATLAAASMSQRSVRQLEVAVHLQAAVERYGWYVDRRAFGCDLYAGGRDAVLHRPGPRQNLTAGRHLQDTWGLARSALGARVGQEEMEAVDRAVLGPSPLPRAQDGAAS